jgi:hypothetical protein
MLFLCRDGGEKRGNGASDVSRERRSVLSLFPFLRTRGGRSTRRFRRPEPPEDCQHFPNSMLSITFITARNMWEFMAEHVQGNFFETHRRTLTSCFEASTRALQRKKERHNPISSSFHSTSVQEPSHTQSTPIHARQSTVHNASHNHVRQQS